VLAGRAAPHEGPPHPQAVSTDLPGESSDDEARIRAQIAFYRERARQHVANLGNPEVQHLVRSYYDDPDVHDLVRAHCSPSRSGLELASGAGRWTGPLLEVCERITTVDISVEMHDVNRWRHGDARVEYVVADLFEYQPEGRYDLIFAGYWLSHVPPARFQGFWSMLRNALAPAGHVVMVDDGVRDADGTERFADDPTGGGDHRRLADGRQFTIVKMAYAPRDLEARLADIGWRAAVTLHTGATYVVVAQPT
jgi:demethylmenaquinone methyltransferase/2-methoxy-6-polyprenyl-1,4-benzoquinol methylase